MSITEDKFSFWKMPKAFYAVLFIEFWERFAFYGLQSIAVFYFVKQFSIKESAAASLFSSFSALLYAMLIVGGFIGDKVLGLRRTYGLGIIFLIFGYGALSIFNTIEFLYFGMGLVLVGNILFKTNAGNYVSRCFRPNDPRLDTAFTYFYMSINFGNVFSMIFVPIIAEKTTNSFGVSICAIGMLCAFISFLVFQRRFSNSDNEIGKIKPNLSLKALVITLLGIGFAYILGQLLHNLVLSKIILYTLTILALVIYLFIASRAPKLEAKGMYIALILIIQAILFFIFYIQMPTSVTLFAYHNLNLNFLGYTVPAGSTQAFNPLFIVLLSPILATVYMYFHAKNMPISIPFKFACGTGFIGIAFALLAFGCIFHDINGLISIWWLVSAYALYSVGELLISAIGLSMVAKLIPQRLGGFAQGIWFISTAVGMRLGGTVSETVVLNYNNSATNLHRLYTYQLLFLKMGLIALAVAIILFIFVKKLTKAMRETLESLHSQ